MYMLFRGLVAAMVLCLGLTPAAAAEQLKIYNWVDYIGEKTIADFEARTGIKVIYDTFDSNETVEAKVIAGSTGYDLIVMASRSLPRLTGAGVFQRLDKSKLPNWKNLDPTILSVIANNDPNNDYAMPYFWGSTGITYNIDRVSALIENPPYESMAMLLDPAHATKLAACGINVLEAPGDVIPMTLSYLGLDPNSEKAEDFDAAAAAWAPVRSAIRSFDSANHLNGLATGELCVSMSWAGDYATATTRSKEANKPVNLRYEVPKTGSQAWMDAFVIPADAPNAAAAYKFLDFLMEPEVIAACTNFTNYANANLAANSFVKPEIISNSAIYPSDEVKKRLWLQKPTSQAGERLRTRAWTRIKSGS